MKSPSQGLAKAQAAASLSGSGSDILYTLHIKILESVVSWDVLKEKELLTAIYLWITTLLMTLKTVFRTIGLAMVNGCFQIQRCSKILCKQTANRSLFEIAPSHMILSDIESSDVGPSKPKNFLF